MVSAVFHTPLDPVPLETASKTEADRLSATVVASPETLALVGNRTKGGVDWEGLTLSVLAPVLGLALLVCIWALVSIGTKDSIPSPWDTLQQAIIIFSDPFYRKGPNDQGVGWNVLMSLERVAMGFGMAAAVGIPAGFAIGRFEFLGRMFNPLISLLRPRVTTGLAADWSDGVQGCQPSSHLDHLHLLHLAHAHQHCCGCATGAARLHERGQGVEPVRVEDRHQDFVPLGAALHADRCASGRRNRLVGDCGGRDADRWRGHWFLGVGRVEQPEREEHHHRHLCDRHSWPDS